MPAPDSDAAPPPSVRHHSQARLTGGQIEVSMKILVTGATGQVGRQVVDHLVQAGQQVRALSRDPAKARAKANLPAEVEVVRGNLADPRSLTPALEGVNGLHLINFDSGDGYNGAILQTGQDIVALAEKAGVSRVTVLQGGPKGALEAAVEESGLEWTLITPVEFMSGALAWAESIRAEGVVREPYGDRLSAVVHAADIGAVTAEVLAKGGHAGKTHIVTGPEALTTRQRVATISETIGRDIEFVELTEDEARELWRASGMPDMVVEFVLAACRDTPPEGYTVSPTVQDVTGHPARTFAQWVTENAEAFTTKG